MSQYIAQSVLEPLVLVQKDASAQQAVCELLEPTAKLGALRLQMQAYHFFTTHMAGKEGSTLFNEVHMYALIQHIQAPTALRALGYLMASTFEALHKGLGLEGIFNITRPNASDLEDLGYKDKSVPTYLGAWNGALIQRTMEQYVQAYEVASKSLEGTQQGTSTMAAHHATLRQVQHYEKQWNSLMQTVIQPLEKLQNQVSALQWAQMRHEVCRCIVQPLAYVWMDQWSKQLRAQSVSLKVQRQDVLAHDSCLWLLGADQQVPVWSAHAKATQKTQVHLTVPWQHFEQLSVHWDPLKKALDIKVQASMAWTVKEHQKPLHKEAKVYVHRDEKGSPYQHLEQSIGNLWQQYAKAHAHLGASISTPMRPKNMYDYWDNLHQQLDAQIQAQHLDSQVPKVHQEYSKTPSVKVRI